MLGSPSPVGSSPDGVSRWHLAFGVAMVMQLVALYAPVGVEGPSIPGLDKFVHVFIFAAPTLAVLMAGLGAWWALGILAVHAPVSELIQHLVLSRRDGDVIDVLADFGGIGLGALAYLVWSRRQH